MQWTKKWPLFRQIRFVYFLKIFFCRPFQTHCPQIRTFALQWSLHEVHATTRAQKYHVLRFRSIMRDAKRISTAFCGRILSAPRKNDRESETKTQNRQGFVWCGGCWSGYDEKTAKNSFRGIQSWISNYFPFVRLEKMFFPKEGSLEDRGTIFHG